MHRRIGLWLALLVTIVAATAAPRAQDMTVTDVAVDATAADAVAARDLAIAEGQAEAFETLLRELAPASADQIRRPSTQRAAEAVESVQINDEQIGTTRYRATLTVTFDPEAVAAELAAQGIGGSVAGASTLIVPVLRDANGTDLWGAGNSWRDAWVIEAERGGGPGIVVPLGDLSDVATVSAEAAEAAEIEPLARLAARYDAGDILVAVAEVDAAAADGVPVLLRLISRDGRVTDRRLRGPPAADASAALAAAVQTSRATLGSAPVAGPVSRVDVVAPLADLQSWVQIKRRLAGIPEVREISVREYARREARLTLAYAGDLGMLQDSLARSGMRLAKENDGWRLLQGGLDATAPSSPPVTP